MNKDEEFDDLISKVKKKREEYHRKREEEYKNRTEGEIQIMLLKELSKSIDAEILKSVLDKGLNN